jgi:hypothetical protein
MTSGLPWVRIDSDIASAPKVADMIAEHGQKGKAAAFVFVAGIGYCAQHLTDGHIKKGALPFIHGTPQDARLLVEARLWDPADKGWRVVNFDRHQPTRQTTEDAAAMRSEKARTAANARWGNA